MPKHIGRPIAPDGADLYYCDQCEKLWREQDLKPMHHSWSNHGDGDEFHPYVCSECGATVAISQGPAFRFEPTTENLTKHAYHSDVSIILVKGVPQLECGRCSHAITLKVPERKISKLKKERKHA